MNQRYIKSNIFRESAAVLMLLSLCSFCEAEERPYIQIRPDLRAYRDRIFEKDGVLCIKYYDPKTIYGNTDEYRYLHGKNIFALDLAINQNSIILKNPTGYCWPPEAGGELPEHRYWLENETSYAESPFMALFVSRYCPTDSETSSYCLTYHLYTNGKWITDTLEDSPQGRAVAYSPPFSSFNNGYFWMPWFRFSPETFAWEPYALRLGHDERVFTMDDIDDSGLDRFSIETVNGNANGDLYALASYSTEDEYSNHYVIPILLMLREGVFEQIWKGDGWSTTSIPLYPTIDGSMFYFSPTMPTPFRYYEKYEEEQKLFDKATDPFLVHQQDRSKVYLLRGDIYYEDRTGRVWYASTEFTQHMLIYIDREIIKEWSQYAEYEYGVDVDLRYGMYTTELKVFNDGKVEEIPDFPKHHYTFYPSRRRTGWPISSTGDAGCTVHFIGGYVEADLVLNGDNYNAIASNDILYRWSEEGGLESWNLRPYELGIQDIAYVDSNDKIYLTLTSNGTACIDPQGEGIVAKGDFGASLRTLSQSEYLSKTYEDESSPIGDKLLADGDYGKTIYVDFTDHLLVPKVTYPPGETMALRIDVVEPLEGERTVDVYLALVGPCNDGGDGGNSGDAGDTEDHGDSGPSPVWFVKSLSPLAFGNLYEVEKLASSWKASTLWKEPLIVLTLPEELPGGDYTWHMIFTEPDADVSDEENWIVHDADTWTVE